MLIRFDMRAKHALLVRWRQRHGLTQAAAAQAAGVPIYHWGRAECLCFRHISYQSLGAIAQLLDVPVTEVCPEEVFRSNLNASWSLEREIDAAQLLEAGQQVQSMLPAPLDVMIGREDVARMMGVLKGELSSREHSIIELRFGLNGNRSHTLMETGKRCGITQERVRQIEAKALRKLSGVLSPARFGEVQPPQAAAEEPTRGRQSPNGG